MTSKRVGGVTAAVLVGMAWLGFAPSLRAQVNERVRLSDIEFHLGGSLYDADHDFGSGGGAFFQGDGLCLESGAFITAYGAAVGFGAFEVDATWNHTRWPWHVTGGRGGGAGGGAALQDFAERHGDALEVVAQARLIRLFRPGALVGRHVSGDALLGAGFQWSFDAEGDDTFNGLPVYDQQGGVAPMVTAGAFVDLHPNNSRVALRTRVTVRRLFVNEVDYAVQGGQIQTFDVDDATYGMLSVGLVVRF